MDVPIRQIGEGDVDQGLAACCKILRMRDECERKGGQRRLRFLSKDVRAVVLYVNLTGQWTRLMQGTSGK